MVGPFLSLSAAAIVAAGMGITTTGNFQATPV